VIIDCIGCLHGARPELQGGDLLIVTGDLTARDKAWEYLDFFLWLDKQKYRKKIVIAGNHDNVLQNFPPIPEALPKNIYYLCDSGIRYEDLNIWGSPWTAPFKGMNPKCKAFTIDNEDHLMDKWELIPHDVDILITHTPAYGILDGILAPDGSLFHVGSKGLYGWLKYVGRPHLHVFSHIHEAHGRQEHFPSYNDKMMISINCSIMDESYKPVNAPIRISF
jgi:hypothetical protein